MKIMDKAPMNNKLLSEELLQDGKKIVKNKNDSYGVVGIIKNDKEAKAYQELKTKSFSD